MTGAVLPEPRARTGRLPAVLAAVGVLAALAVLVAAVGVVGAAPAPAAAGAGPQGRVPQFVVPCPYSHSATDDPIVYPGEPGLSHRHDFFGNTTTDAFSTSATLRGGPTTCQQQLDAAAYWAPSLFDHGEPVVPVRSDAYYRPGPGVDPTTLTPFPTGLMMISGDAHATEEQPTGVVGWRCGASPRVSATPPECPDAAPLRLRVVFPDCWDGRRLDSADHKAHLARSVRGACPPSHPVAIPQLIFVVEYPVTGEGHDLELASGGLGTAHADFLDGWDPAKLATEVELCLGRGVVCKVISNRGNL